MNTQRAKAKLAQEIIVLVVIIVVIIVATVVSSGKKLSTTKKAAPAPHLNTEFDKPTLDVVRVKDDNYVKVAPYPVGKADPFNS